MSIRVWISICLLLGISYCDSFVEKKIHLTHECNSVKVCYQYPVGCEMDKCEGGFTVARANILEPTFGTIYEIYVPVLVEPSNYIAIESTNLKTGEKYVRLCLPNEKRAMFAYKGNALSIDEKHVMEVMATMFSEEPYSATTICVFKDAVPMKHGHDEVFVSEVTTGVLSNDTYYPPKMTIQIVGATKLDFDFLDNFNFSDPVLEKDSEEEVNEAGLNSEEEVKKTFASATDSDQSLTTEGAVVQETIEKTTVGGPVTTTSVEESNGEITTEGAVEETSTESILEESTVKESAERTSSKESAKKNLVEEFVEETSVGATIGESAVQGLVKETSDEETSKEVISERPAQESSETFEEPTVIKSANRKSSKESVKKPIVEESVEEDFLEENAETSKDRHNERHITSSSLHSPVSSSSTTGPTRKNHKKDHLDRSVHNTGGQTRLAASKSTARKSELPEESSHEVDDVVKDSVREELRSLNIDEDEPAEKPTAPKRTQSFRQRDQYERREHHDKERKQKSDDHRRSMGEDYRNEKEKHGEDKKMKEEDDMGETENTGNDREKERNEEKGNSNVKADFVRSKSTEVHPKNLHRHQDAQIGSDEDEDSASSCSLVLPVVLALWALV